MRTRILPCLALASLSVPVLAQEPVPPDVKSELEALRAAQRETDARIRSLLDLLEERSREGSSPAAPAWTERFTLGGYGEIHLNSEEGSGGEQLDIHRFVAYLGYRFEDWIQLHSETEIEHAFVEDGNGELSIEQLHVDFLLGERLNVRAGRFLTPLGIVNPRHEPTTFNGVERPAFDTFVIPSTWSTDGAGIFGNLSEDVKYELYLGSSLDGSGFDPVTGIRGGRQEERPGVSEPALSGRLDWFPACGGGDLRLGTSIFAGGLDNGNQGQNPGIDADLRIYSLDFERRCGRFDFRGVYAFEDIDGAASIGNDVGSAIDGWYLETGYHFWPDGWKEGRWQNSDAVAFLRYDAIDTQRELPAGATANPAAERQEWTFGVSFFPTSNLVIKADAQIRDDDSPDGLPERFNLGLGWIF